jgi:hypothetical protein
VIFLHFRCEKNGGGGREWRKVALADTDTLAGGYGTGNSLVYFFGVVHIIIESGNCKKITSNI